MIQVSPKVRSEAAKRGWIKRKPTFIPPMKGKKMSADSRLKMSASAKKRGSNRTGARHSIETRAKISATVRERTPRGPKCHSFKDGLLAERRDQRFSQQYKRWRYDVFLRDGFACQRCGDARGGNLIAHHIKEFATHPRLRFEVSNGLTVCGKCHKAIHSKP